MTIMIIISILIINWGCFSSRLHYCPRLGLLVHALGSPEQECNLHGLPSPASRCRRGNLYKNNYSYHQRYYYHYYHCLYRDVEGATYIKIIILIINVTIIITIIVYTRVAQEYQYTPNLRHLV